MNTSNLWRTTSEEKRELERLENPMYNSVRRAAEVHRQVAIFYVNAVLLKMKRLQNCPGR